MQCDDYGIHVCARESLFSLLSTEVRGGVSSLFGSKSVLPYNSLSFLGCNLVSRAGYD